MIYGMYISVINVNSNVNLNSHATPYVLKRSFIIDVIILNVVSCGKLSIVLNFPNMVVTQTLRGLAAYL